ncbi:hypothetical protein, partial [Campylobacter jejuni]|uniref:hypothetical protein n=1 Tax=Campylobacter jejuni TaxID=197 RepID=UPI0028F29591
SYCKKIEFSYDYFEDNGTPPSGLAHAYKKLKLEQIQEKSCNNSITIPPYTFEYYGDIVNGKIFLPNRMSKAIDHWGYY